MTVDFNDPKIAGIADAIASLLIGVHEPQIETLSHIVFERAAVHAREAVRKMAVDRWSLDRIEREYQITLKASQAMQRACSRLEAMKTIDV